MDQLEIVNLYRRYVAALRSWGDVRINPDYIAFDRVAQSRRVPEGPFPAHFYTDEVWRSRLSDEANKIIQQWTNLALQSGVRDKSYPTVRYGWVPSYEGVAEFDVENGRIRATGLGPRGDAHRITREGGICFELV